MKSNLLTLSHLGFCCLLWNWKFWRVLRLVSSVSKRPNQNLGLQTLWGFGGIWSGLDYDLYCSSLLPSLAGDLCKVSGLCISMLFARLPVHRTRVPLPVCDDDPVDFRYEGESGGAETQMTKQEGGQRSTLGIQSLVLLTDPRVRFALTYEWGQRWDSCTCPSSTGVWQGKKELCRW